MCHDSNSAVWMTIKLAFGILESSQIGFLFDAHKCGICSDRRLPYPDPTQRRGGEATLARKRGPPIRGKVGLDRRGAKIKICILSCVEPQ